MDPALIRLIADAANVERESLQQREFEPRRRRFLAHVERQRFRQHARHWFVLLAAAALAVVLTFDAFRSPRSLSFEVQGRPRGAGDWLTANGPKPLDVAFSDGSSLSLTGGARARVTELHGDGASVVLERGSLTADVVHGKTTKWRFDAGPYSVRVLGTKFDLAWDASREKFALRLAQGSVAVSGPKLQTRCLVRAGQQLEIELPVGKGSGPCVALEPAPRAAVKPELTDTAVVESAPSPGPPRKSWQALAARGEYEAAWAAVSTLGFEQLKQRASAHDLMVLADLARYARKSDQATQALLELRQRFAGSGEASHAAFLLGRIAADQQGSPLRGAEWFSSYLSERPHGPFAPESLGRLLECQNRAGQLAASRKTAARYLQLYPTGAYSALARHVVGTSGGAEEGSSLGSREPRP